MRLLTRGVPVAVGRIQAVVATTGQSLRTASELLCFAQIDAGDEGPEGNTGQMSSVGAAVPSVSLGDERPGLSRGSGERPD